MNRITIGLVLLLIMASFEASAAIFVIQPFNLTILNKSAYENAEIQPHVTISCIRRAGTERQESCLNSGMTSVDLKSSGQNVFQFPKIRLQLSSASDVKNVYVTVALSNSLEAFERSVTWRGAHVEKGLDVLTIYSLKRFKVQPLIDGLPALEWSNRSGIPLYDVSYYFYFGHRSSGDSFPSALTSGRAQLKPDGTADFSKGTWGLVLGEVNEKERVKFWLFLGFKNAVGPQHREGIYLIKNLMIGSVAHQLATPSFISPDASQL